MANSKKDTKPINDVVHADQAAPEPSAKPVIVTNRPIMKDPMVVPGEAAASELTEAETVQVKVHSKPELKLATAEPPEPTAQVEDQAEAETAPQPEEAKSATEPEPAKPANTSAEAPGNQPAETGEGQIPEQDSDSSGTTKEGSVPDAAAVDEAEAAKQAEHDATIQKLTDSKGYFLPINAVEKRNSKRFVLLGLVLSLVLALAWTDIALDAGLIQISGIKPVTHFFSN